MICLGWDIDIIYFQEEMGWIRNLAVVLVVSGMFESISYVVDIFSRNCYSR